MIVGPHVGCLIWVNAAEAGEVGACPVMPVMLQNDASASPATSSAQLNSSANSHSSITRAAGNSTSTERSLGLQTGQDFEHTSSTMLPLAVGRTTMSPQPQGTHAPADIGGIHSSCPINMSSSKRSSDSESSDEEFAPVVLPKRMYNKSPVVASSSQQQQNPQQAAPRRPDLVFEAGIDADNCRTPPGAKKRPRQKDISRMDRDKVASFDLAVMDPDNKALYRGDQRLKQHRPFAQKCPRFSARAENATTIMSMRKALLTQCCKYHGQLQHANVSIDLISGVRSWYHKQLSNKERQNFLTQLWDERFNRGSWEVNGVPICYQGVGLLLGISAGCLFKGKQRCLWGVELGADVIMTEKVAIMTQAVRGWIDDFVLRYSEKMPHRSYLHLPSCFTKAQLAQLCRKDISFKTKDDKWRRPSVRLFYAVWAEHFPHVTIPRLSDFSSCNICAKLLQRRLGKNLTFEAKTQLDDDDERASTFHFLFDHFDSPAPRAKLIPVHSCLCVLAMLDRSSLWPFRRLNFCLSF